MKRMILALILILSILFQGCSNQTTEDSTDKTIRIAEQYGIAYAPLQIMRHNEILEEKLPGVKVVWEQMINTAAIREAMIADKLDVGFMAIPPFYIGWDKGMDWKIFTGLSSVPVGLVAGKEFKTLGDISKDDRIALPQPGSVQHILLSMACDDLFDDPQRMDNQLITLSHPDGLNALLTGDEIQAHFTSTPYLEAELKDKDFHQILDGKKAFGGDFSFIVGVTTENFHNENQRLYEGLGEAVAEAIQFINENPKEATAILENYYDISQEELEAYITQDGTSYSSVVKGTKKFSDFMKKTGYITKTYESMDEILWDGVEYEE